MKRFLSRAMFGAAVLGVAAFAAAPEARADFLHVVLTTETIGNKDQSPPRRVDLYVPTGQERLGTDLTPFVYSRKFKEKEKGDFITLDSGSAGLTVLARLDSDNKTVEVLANHRALTGFEQQQSIETSDDTAQGDPVALKTKLYPQQPWEIARFQAVMAGKTVLDSYQIEGRRFNIRLEVVPNIDN
ncbi:MAG: hypothetical protein J0H82_15885 [Alphaproteobacteria bacterium]|jgi:hypothetical protein|nr:hypothetical protein [Alphaproteobacteria bacterium]